MGIKNKKISIDFDGIFNNYTGWKGEKWLGSPKSGIRNFLYKLEKANIEIIVLTTRKPISLIKKWFKDNNLPLPSKITNNKVKVPVYIDDRAICFNGDFNKLIKDLANFEVYWKKGKPFKMLNKSE